MLRVILLIASLLICFQGTGQTDPDSEQGYPPESIRVHLSETCLFPGSVIAFKIYCTNPGFPALELSRIAFLELLNEQNKPVLRRKTELKNGSGAGVLVLPSYMGTGIYTLICYTNWQKNFGETTFHRQNIVIINPEQDLPMEYDSSDCPGIYTRPGNMSRRPQKGMIVRTNKEKYGTREKVSLELALPMKNGGPAGGNFSVSVCYREPELTKDQVSEPVHEGSQKTRSMEYLPDFNGIRMSGIIEDASGKAIPGKRVILSEPGPGTRLKSALSDKEGTFHFLLRPQDEIKDFVFTLPENNAIMKLEEPFWNGFRNPPEAYDLCLQKSTLPYLEDKYYHTQMQNRFNQQNFLQHGPEAPETADSSSFHADFSHVLKVDDYILLDSLPEFFYELVSNVRFVRNKGTYDIRISDPETGLPFKEKPGIFVDGVLYSDYTRIAHIPMYKIDQIAVLPAVYYYGSFAFGGIVDLHTKDADFNSVPLLPDMTRIMIPLASKSEMEFSAPDYSHPDDLKRIPDFRHLICWDPDVRVDSAGDSGVQFYTGDLSGDFTVKVCGLSDDGQFYQSETSIWIE